LEAIKKLKKEVSELQQLLQTSIVSNLRQATESEQNLEEANQKINELEKEKEESDKRYEELRQAMELIEMV